jgi:hypothetical protein
MGNGTATTTTTTATTEDVTDDNTPATPLYDNPLYNCGNGGKTNCPGNRAGAAGTEGAGDGSAIIVFEEVQKTFPQVTFDSNYTVLPAHNGHANITVVGTAKDLDGFQARLKEGRGFFPGHRYDNRIGNSLYSLHVKDVAVNAFGGVTLTAHIDSANPNRDLWGFIKHTVVDVIGGPLSHPNDSGLDPQP